jgi:5S rRNA maturation endonuclease (ribonuclease M5)
VTVEEFVSRLDGASGAGGGHVARCPAHQDDRASLSVGEGDDGRVLLRCFAGCEPEAVVAALGLEMKDLFPAKEKPVRQAKPAPPPLSADEVAAMAKALREDADAWRHVTEVLKFSPEVVEQLQLGLRGGGRRWLAYPYRRSGAWTFANCRSLSGEKDFFRHPRGQATHLYLLDSLEDTGTAIVFEGERDAAAALTLGLDAGAVVAMPGAEQVKVAAEALAKQKIIYIATDSDAPGEEAAEKLAARLGPERCRRVRFPGFKDLGDLLSEKGVEEARLVAVEAIAAALKAPPPEATAKRAKRGTSIVKAVEPAAEAQDTAALLSDLVDAFGRHLVLPEGASLVLATWAMHTWVVKVFYFTPRLVVTSPTRRCGKTLMLELLEMTSARPILSASLTAATLFRAVEAFAPTLLVDEADNFLEASEELRGIINAGYRRSGTVLRCVGDSHEVKQFRCFGPVAVAAIGSVPSTIADRAFSIKMSRRGKGEKVERIDRGARAALASLPPRLMRWAEDSLEALEGVTVEAPESLNDRQREIAEPLLAVAKMAGNEWPERVATAILALCRASMGDDTDVRERLLSAVWDIFEPVKDDDFFTQKVIVEKLLEESASEWHAVGRNEKPLTTRVLGKWLRRFDLQASQSRVSDRERGYYRRDLVPVAGKYRILDRDTVTEGDNQVEEQQKLSTTLTVTPTPPVTVKDPEKPNGSAAVTVSRSGIQGGGTEVEVPLLTAEQIWGVEGVAEARRQALAQECGEVTP